MESFMKRRIPKCGDAFVCTRYWHRFLGEFRAIFLCDVFRSRWRIAAISSVQYFTSAHAVGFVFSQFFSRYAADFVRRFKRDNVYFYMLGDLIITVMGFQMQAGSFLFDLRRWTTVSSRDCRYLNSCFKPFNSWCETVFAASICRLTDNHEEYGTLFHSRVNIWPTCLPSSTSCWNRTATNWFQKALLELYLFKFTV